MDNFIENIFCAFIVVVILSTMRITWSRFSPRFYYWDFSVMENLYRAYTNPFILRHISGLLGCFLLSGIISGSTIQANSYLVALNMGSWKDLKLKNDIGEAAAVGSISSLSNVVSEPSKLFLNSGSMKSSNLSTSAPSCLLLTVSLKMGSGTKTTLARRKRFTSSGVVKIKGYAW